LTIADDTFAGRLVKPLWKAAPGIGLGNYRDNGGVNYAAYACTRTGETFNSRDVSKCASANDHPLGVVVEVIHADGSSWDYDEIAADNDIVVVAERASGHVVYMMILSAQGDIPAGTLMMVDAAGRAKIWTVAAASGDSIDQIRKDMGLLIGHAYEGIEQDASDPKDCVLGQILLDV